ncbi:hypothetical protein LCY76_23420 [Fictibacillus sp. KIGAM418]|uniref:TraG P-loop domain-containing protein n=1 Tax=Fictibacillus marinisediminis TaxID=2878389 RepID=A0A9X2BG83_9BACL|nr:hypothetical protein [Fictibacillus marinisediminis]MCK6259525.1 hypothetical protein [Fictibacillus marinisediminis]
MKLLKKKTVQKSKTPVKQAELDQQISDETVAYQIESKPNFWDIISPDGLKINAEDYGTIKQSLGTKTFFRPFYIPRGGYPRKMQTNWLSALTSTGEVDVLIDIHKMGRTNAIKTLQKQLTMLKSNLFYQKKKGNIDQISELETKIADTEILMEEIQFGDNDFFLVGTHAVAYANSLKELNRFSEFLQDEMNGGFFTLASTWSRVKKGFLSVLPLGENHIEDSLRNMDRRALSTFSPFISGSGKYTGGIPIGVNKITGQKEFLNPFGNEEYRPDNYNSAIFGVSGSGKTLAMKLQVARGLSTAGIHYGIIDPDGEMRLLVNRLGGIYLDINEESDIIINPFALNFSDIPLDDKDDEEIELLEEDDTKEIIERDGKKYLRFVPIREKVNQSLDFLDVVVSGNNDERLNVFERNYLEEALLHIIEDLKITTHPSSLFQNDVKVVDGQILQSSVRKPEPEMLQIYTYITERYGNEPKAERIIAALKPFLRTGSKPIFDGQTFLGRGVTNSLENSRLVAFNISQLEESYLRPIGFHVIFNYLWEYFAKNINNAKKKKMIVTPELWQFVDSEQTVDFFEKVARRIRKRNGGILYDSQDFVRLLESKKARGILQNTHTLLFFKQAKIDLKKIRENFDLTDGEIDILFNNPDKGEGIFRAGKSSIWLRTDPSEEEMTFVESNQAVLDEYLKRKKMRESL